MRRLGVEDRAEASTIASVICKWGYIFPVENNYTPFKDDSTWMRFQSNLFWPSQNWDPDNTDYGRCISLNDIDSVSGDVSASHIPCQETDER
jgi:hypothetical protein